MVNQQFELPSEAELEDCFSSLIGYVSADGDTVLYERGVAELKEFVTKAVERAVNS